MIKFNKTKLYTILANIIIIVTVHYGIIAFDLYNNIKSRIYDDFIEFGNSLESLNDSISKILITDNKDLKDMDVKEVKSLIKSDRIVSRLDKEKIIYDYNFMYVTIDEVIKNILSDELITMSEEKYLETLYDYNNELITELKNILGDLYNDDNYDFEKRKKVEKKIIKIYSRYSKMADSLLESKKYRFLKDYEGDFTKEYSTEDFEKVKLYCEEVFLKVVSNGYLKYNNKNEKNSQIYEFRTHSEEDHFNSPIDDDAQYVVEYNKKTKVINLDAVSYIIGSEDKIYTEDDLDDIVNNIIHKFNNKLTIFNRKVNYDSEEKMKIDRIDYSYIEKVDDIYDETKKVDITVQRNGMISSFEIMYPNNEKIVLPTITEEQILNKLNNKAKVKDVITIRNIEGKIEYEVHFRYKNVLYAAVFDGYDGKLKYYGRNIRIYGNEN